MHQFKIILVRVIQVFFKGDVMSRTYGVYINEFIKFIESIPCPQCEERRKRRIVENLSKYLHQFNKSDHFSLSYTKMKKIDLECQDLIKSIEGNKNG